jgi:hypothetical protein
MSNINQPENTTLQFGDNYGNIYHRGVLGSNLNNTLSISSTFPTTPTGASLGHYHYTEDGSGALKFLNACGSGTGGHQFYVSSSTTAPFKTATIDQDGFTIDNSTGGIVLVNLPALISATAIECVFTYPPGLDTFGIQFGVYNNPVRVLFNSGPFVTGVTYYTQATNAQSLRFRTTTNPSDPLLDCSSFSSGQIPWAFVQSNTPSVTQTANLNDNLTITTDTNVSTLSSTSLTFNNINVKMNQVTPTLIYSSAAIYADGQPPATSLTIRNTYGYSGWYIKNIVLGQKINWYFPPKNATNTLVSSLKGISISFFNGVTVSNDNTLFITIYTRPTGSGDYAPGFFHSSNTYIFNQSISPVANTNYQGVCIIDKSLIPFNFETQIQYQQSTVNNPKGTFSQTDNILAVTIGSNSTSAVNSVEFVVNKLNLHYNDFTQSYLLVSP